MIIYLIRHGETDYNKARCFYGRTDVSINETGKQQAKNLAAIMAQYPVVQIYTSSLKRSQETARLVFPRQDHCQLALAGFDERDFGAWEGLTADEIEARFPSEWANWLESPFEVTPPRAESFSHFHGRVTHTLDQILAGNCGHEPVAIVAHLGVLRLIYQILVDREVAFWDIDFPQWTVNRLSLSTSKGWTTDLLGKEGGTDDPIYD